MLLKNLRASFRFLYRNKGFTLINILGLAMGIASAVLIFLYVYDELRFDRHHEKKDRIYMVCRDGVQDGNAYQSGWTTPPMAAAMKEDYPEIESYARMALWYSEYIFEVDKIKYPERFVVAADSTVFDIFSIPFLHGDPHTALDRPLDMVISRSTALKYFGEENAVGKSIYMPSRDRHYQVTGVVDDQPKQSHFYFDLMFSLSTFGDYASSQAWFNHTFMSYLLLKEGQKPEELEAKFPDFVLRHLGPYVKKATGKSLEEMFEDGTKYDFILMPLEDIHLSKMISDDQGTRSFIYILCLIGVMILLIASINYMNLSTALASSRSREVGIRKTIGASRSHLVRRYLGESLILSFIAFAIGMLLVEVLIPQFNHFIEKSIHIDYFSNALIIPGMALVIVLLSLLAGFYPALFLSRYKPVLAIKGQISEKRNRGGLMFRNFLVLFQFTICIVFLIGTMAVNRQLKYMMSKDLGFDKEGVMVIHRAEGLGDKQLVFKEQLLALPEVASVSYSYTTPARHHNEQGHHIKGDPQHEYPSLFVAWADLDYLKTMGLTLVQGRDFDKRMAMDQYSAIVNETAARKLARPDGSAIIFDESPGPAVDSMDYQVIGVVKDFHFAHLDQEIADWIVYPMPEDNMSYASYVNVKLKTSKSEEVIKEIEALWELHTEAYPYEYTFLDEDFEKLFRKESKARKMFGWFSVFAIVIACLGLLGLAAFSANQKTKQIGIRKAMGSTSLQVQILLSKQFSRLVLISAVIALPLTWFLVRGWLQNYTYRIDMPYWAFLLGAVSALLLALLTVSYHAWRVASRNPAESLRYE